MVPINQVILGGVPLLGNSVVGTNLDDQLQLLERYKQNLEAAKQMKQQIQPAAPVKLIWDDIDAEVNPMTEEQRARLFQDEEYAMNYAEIQGLVQQEILNLVKGRIESTEKGRELLNSQLKIIRKLKSKIIDDTNREMEMFKKFKEFSKTNPTITYDEFIKANL
jgi:hypothetical protein